MNSFNELKEKENLYKLHTREAGKSFTRSALVYSTLAFFGWNPLILGVSGISFLQGLGHLCKQQENYPVLLEMKNTNGDKIKMPSVSKVKRDEEFIKGFIDGIMMFDIENVLNFIQNGQNIQK